MNRITPNLPAAAYQTYELAVPLPTHWRPATCAEIDCPAYLYGWATTVLPDSADEALIRRAGRHFTVERTPDGFLRFVFPAGQPCFAASAHRVQVEREPLYLVRGGDFRGNPRRIPTRVHADATDWVDDFGEHQLRIAESIERG